MSEVCDSLASYIATENALADLGLGDEPRLAGLNWLRSPVWLVQLDPVELVWANHAAREQLGARLLDWVALVANDPTPYRTLAANGGAQVVGGFDTAGNDLQVVCSCLELGGRNLLLVEAQPVVAAAAVRLETVAWLHRRDLLIEGSVLATQRLLTVPDRHRAVAAALAALGEAIGAERLTIFRYHPHPVTGDPLASQQWEWCRCGVAPQIDNLEWQNLSYRQICPGWHERLVNDSPLIATIELLAEPFQSLLAEAKGSRLLVVPITVRGDYWGFLVVNERPTVPGEWSLSEQSILHATAASIGGAIDRHQTSAKLESLMLRLESLVEQRTVKLRAAIQQLENEVEERRRAETLLRYNALHDSLTGLPNRSHLIERVGELGEADSAGSSCPSFALLFVDVDRFKSINDAHGHRTGDELLVALAHRLRRCVRPNDMVARLGGDEFAILLRDTQSHVEAETVAAKIHASLVQPISLGDREILTSVSIGIVLSSRENLGSNRGDSYRPEALLRDADIFMRQAKSLGRSQSAVFDRTVQQKVLTSLRLENDLRRAITHLEAQGLDSVSYKGAGHHSSGNKGASTNSQFAIFYQPIFDTQSLTIRKFEALVRWTHPELGPISPARFIPIAEDTGGIDSLGLWVMHQSCAQLATWQQQFPRLGNAAPDKHRPLKVAVNLSARQFSRLDLLDRIDQVLANSAIVPGSLEMELTETTIVENADLATATLQALRSRQIHICMDDFGTGYSSLSYLHRFPLDVLKIDRSFVGRIERGEEGRAIISAIVSLASNLHLETVAEGVETPAQLQLLRQLGCTLVQGFLFARPLDAATATHLLETGYPTLS